MTRTYVFAGGGTGGHIFPALAIAERLKELDPDARFAFLTSDKPLDAEILHGRDATPLPARPFLKSPGGLVRFLASWGPSVRATRDVLRSASNEGPAHLIAMGGYVCAPACRAARSQRVPITLVNLDAVPGLANRYAARLADRVVTAVPAGDWEVVGPIVRPAIAAAPNPEDARRALGLDAARPTLFVSGGSQGARSINQLVRAFVESHANALVDNAWQVLHQTGRDADPDLASVYERAGVRARVVEFIDGMPSAWGAADLAIARAGAGTVAEALATRTPAVFFPFPYHADEHQRRNARPLVDAGGALCLTDRVDAAANLREHAPELVSVFADPARIAGMRDALTGLDAGDGARRLAQILADPPSRTD